MLTFIKTQILSGVVLLTTLVLNSPAFAQNPSADEQAIRKLVDRQNAGERLNTTDQSIFWSGAYATPRVGKVTQEEGKKIAAEFAKQRANNKQSIKIDRLVVAQSGDVAYEYGTFNLQFDMLPEKTHVDHDGAYLRTWRKEKEQWLVDAVFMRPFGDMSIVADTGARK